MAHDGPKRPPRKIPPSTTASDTTVTGSFILADDDLATSDGASMDKLLAQADDVWDVEEQARTLRTAAGQTLVGTTLAPPPTKTLVGTPDRPAIPRAPTLRMPRPDEFASTQMQIAKPSLTAKGPSKATELGVAAPRPAPSPAPPSVAPSQVPSDPPPASAQAPLSKAGGKPPPLPPRGAKPPPLPPRGGKPAEVASVRAAEKVAGGTEKVVAEAPPPKPAKFVPPANAEAQIDLVRARVATLEGRDDRVGTARAWMELSVLHEVLLGDEATSAEMAKRALEVEPHLSAAHAVLRRHVHDRTRVPEMLVHLDDELATATSEAAVVELLAEKARLVAARPNVTGADTIAAWQLALSRSPNHPASLKGLEAELQKATQSQKPETWEALAAHLFRLAEASTDDPKLAAWIHVERARILEFKLGRADAARGGFERALELDHGIGPVRDSVVRHIGAHDDAATLASLLEQEAEMEANPSRAARLEVDAACIVASQLGDAARATAILQRAAARAPTTPSVDRRALDELVRLLEQAGHYPPSVAARRARLRFISDPTNLAYELRALSALCERIGDLPAAIADLQRAFGVVANDPTLAESLDRLLARAGRDEERVAVWVTESARTESKKRRADALLRAAHISERTLLRPEDAIRHLRGAWLSDPGNDEVLDSLSRLLSPDPEGARDANVRALADLYAQAADHTQDAKRKVAYLEKTALLWEEVLGDPRHAARAYESILAIEPDRRGAILGLGRTAGNVGDDKLAAKALLDEARLAGDPVLERDLTTRAATRLARVDSARALSLVTRVLEGDTAHTEARAVETRLHEDAGRWDLCAKSLRARVDLATQPNEKVPLLLVLAQVEETRLRNLDAALRTLEQARELDPKHPVPPDAIARLLYTTGDDVALRTAFENLAGTSLTSDERAHWLVRAAEIDELRLGDSLRAAKGFARALEEQPEDELTAERLLRCLSRQGLPGPTDRDPAVGRPVGTTAKELVALVAQRMEHATSAALRRKRGFELAVLLAELGEDVPRASQLLANVLDEDKRHAPALRTLESLARRTGDASMLAKILAKQGEAFGSPRARIGALWNLAWLEEWKLDAANPIPTYRAILSLDGADVGALDATVRHDLPGARRGEHEARRRVTESLRALAALAADEASQLGLELRLALLLEQWSEGTEPVPGGPAHEALERFRSVLRTDALSVTAATGCARLAVRTGDADAAVAAALSLSDLSVDKGARARYLLDASDILVSDAPDERLGEPRDRRRRAALLLEKALDFDPNSTVLVGRLVHLLLEEEGDPVRLVETLRVVLRRATEKEAILVVGNEIARIARDDLADVNLAIDAIRKVREAVPDHVPTMLTLSELCIAGRSWNEAVSVLETVIKVSDDPAPKLTALFALAGIQSRVFQRPEETEKALREALAIDNRNPRAIRALLRHLTTASAMTLDEAATVARDVEIADLVEKLAGVEKDPTQRSTILLELVDHRVKLGDMAAAEKALVEATAQSPNHPRAMKRLRSFFGPRDTRDYVGLSRALSSVIARGSKLGTTDPAWLLALGQIEVEALGRMKEGVVAFQKALQLDPNFHEARYYMAHTYARMNGHEDAARAILALISPTSAPLAQLADPGGALAILERSFSAERRSEEAIVVSELRAVAGTLDDGRQAWLRGRRLGPFEAHHTVLDRPTIVTQILPPEARHILLEVAAAMSGIESKMLRAEMSELGITGKDRIGPRSQHPLRPLLDRMTKALGITEVELAVSNAVNRTRVLAGDEPWIVVPRALLDLPEPSQLASIARALARIAMGVPWLEELPPPHVEAYLVACARQVVPGFAADDLDVLSSKLVTQYESAIPRHIARRQKKILEELAPHIASPQGRPLPVEVFIAGLARAELRVAYVVTGDLLAAIDELRGLDPSFARATDSPSRSALTTILEHPYAGDLCRFALSSEAVALRRRVGSAWTG
ncbi:MAG: hypothetical protein U0169_26985 [Polyangiaceae bacterium]